MADVALTAGGSEAAPLDYTIPGAQEVIVKAANATFDGSGAVGHFVPTLQVLAPNGAELASCPVGETVAAGASADVSWFPWRGLTPSAAPVSDLRNLYWALFWGSINLPDNSAGEPFTVGFPEVTPFTGFKTNDSTIFRPGTGPNFGRVCVKKDGIYIFHVALANAIVGINSLPYPGPPKWALSLTAGFGNDPEQPFGQDVVYGIDQIGSIACSTIGSVGGSGGNVVPALTVGVENASGFTLDTWVGVIVFRAWDQPEDLFP